VSPLEPGPIYAPGAGPPHPAVLRRRAQAAAPPPAPPQPAPVAQPVPVAQPAPAAQPAGVAQPTAPVRVEAPPVAAAREGRRFDWVLGIMIGIVLGLAVAAGFVFLGSEDTVDAPRIHGIDTGKLAEPPSGGEAAPAETEKLPAE
jgi:uncharacterized membrane protein